MHYWKLLLTQKIISLQWHLIFGTVFRWSWPKGESFCNLPGILIYLVGNDINVTRLCLKQNNKFSNCNLPGILVYHLVMKHPLRLRESGGRVLLFHHMSHLFLWWAFWIRSSNIHLILHFCQESCSLVTFTCLLYIGSIVILIIS